MRWTVKRVKGLSIAEQLAEQIRYAIATGQLKPGDQLPPGRILAQELKVHFNTVFAIYRQLEREGLLVLKQGSGAYVAPISLDNLKQSTQTKLEQALSTLLELVRMGLVEPNELKRLIDERLRELQRTLSIPKVTFIECNLEQMETCCAQLSQTLGTKVEPILLDEACKEPDRLHPFSLIVTTYLHFREVASLASESQRVLPVLSVPSHKALEGMANLPPQTRLGVICRDKVSLPTIVQQVHQFSGIEPSLSAWLGDRKGIRCVLSECDAIVYMPPCRSRVLSSAPKGKALIEFEHEIDRSSLEEVRLVFEQMKSSGKSEVER